MQLLPEIYVVGKWPPSDKKTLQALAMQNLAKFMFTNPKSPQFLAITPDEVSLICSEEDSEGWEGGEVDGGWSCFKGACG
jgi:hypothetical protein